MGEALAIREVRIREVEALWPTEDELAETAREGRPIVAMIQQKDIWATIIVEIGGQRALWVHRQRHRAVEDGGAIHQAPFSVANIGFQRHRGLTPANGHWEKSVYTSIRIKVFRNYLIGIRLNGKAGDHTIEHGRIQNSYVRP
jgi:hypothetical protein